MNDIFVNCLLYLTTVWYFTYFKQFKSEYNVVVFNIVDLTLQLSCEVETDTNGIILGVSFNQTISSQLIFEFFLWFVTIHLECPDQYSE